jgi:hypothetical protein
LLQEVILIEALLTPNVLHCLKSYSLALCQASTTINLFSGRLLNQHGGAIGGYNSVLYLFPDMDIGIFASANGPGYISNDAPYGLRTILWHVVDEMFGTEPWLNASTACSYPSRMAAHQHEYYPPQPTDHPDRALDADVSRYTGTYGHHLFGEARIEESNSDNGPCLTVTFGRRLHGLLHPTNVKDVFDVEIVQPLEAVAPGHPVVPGIFSKSPGSSKIDIFEFKMIPIPVTYKKNVRFADPIPPNPSTQTIPVASSASTFTCILQSLVGTVVSLVYMCMRG